MIILVKKYAVSACAVFPRAQAIRGSGRGKAAKVFSFVLLASCFVWTSVSSVFASETIHPSSTDTKVRLKIKPREDVVSVPDSGSEQSVDSAPFSDSEYGVNSVTPSESGFLSHPVSESAVLSESGTIVIQCSNVENNNPLEGCIFEVSSTGAADYKERVYTDSFGTASLEDVPFGTCIVKQIGSAEGFVSDENPVSIVLNSTHSFDTCAFSNSQLLGTLTIKVTDENGIALDGQKIRVTNLQEDFVIFKGSIDKSVELKLPLGFYNIALGKKAMAVTLNAGSLDQEVTLVKSTKSGVLSVQFYDFDTNECVSDGVFSCTNLATGESQSFTINSVGNEIPLAYGEYSIQQTTASSGYQLNDNVYHVLVDSKKSFVAFPVSSKEDGIVSFHLFKSNGEALPGIELDLSYAGSVVASGKTDKDGYLIFTGVPTEYKYSYSIKTEVVGYELPKIDSLAFTSNLIHRDLVFREIVIPIQISVVNEKEESLRTRLLSVKEFDVIAKRYREVRCFFSSSNSVWYLPAGLYKIDVISTASRETVFSHEFNLEASMHPVMFVITENFKDKISYRCNDTALSLVAASSDPLASEIVSDSAIVSGSSMETGIRNSEDFKTDQEILEELGLQEHQVTDKQIGKEEPKDYTIVFIVVVVVIVIAIASIVFWVFILPKVKEKYYRFRL